MEGLDNNMYHTIFGNLLVCLKNGTFLIFQLEISWMTTLSFNIFVCFDAILKQYDLSNIYN